MKNADLPTSALAMFAAARAHTLRRPLNLHFLRRLALHSTRIMEGLSDTELIERQKAYWDSTQPTVDGMLGGCVNDRIFVTLLLIHYAIDLHVCTA